MVRPASRVSKVLMTGPLAPFADAYAVELKRRRYSPLTSVNQLRQVARLSSWLEVQGLEIAELTGERVEEFLAVQRPPGGAAPSGHARACGVCWTCCGGWECWRPENQRGRFRQRTRCWLRLSATCLPSGAWQRVLPAAM